MVKDALTGEFYWSTKEKVAIAMGALAVIIAGYILYLIFTGAFN